MSDSLSIKWSIQKKFLFLFLVSYTFFYIFPFPFDAFPQLDFIFRYYEKANNMFVLFIGKHILHIQGLKKLIYSDSGDTLFDFVKFFIFFFLSVIAAAAILFIDRRRNNYEKLQGFLYLYLRYCIGFYMLVYGFDKVFKSHFPFPSLEKLNQPLGESSPQGLLWAFMGYSTTYSVYLGIVEVCSGFLLLFRRTTALGALLVLIIMLNVTILNFSYDVPVKLFALHMVAFALVLSYPFLRSVYSFFVLKKLSQLPEQQLVVFPKRIEAFRKLIKAAVIISFTSLFISFSYANMKTDGDDAPEPALYGIYSGDHILRLISKPDQLQSHQFFTKIIFDKKYAIIPSSKGNLYFETHIDTVKKRVLLISNIDRSKMSVWHYTINDYGLELNGRKATVLFKKIDTKSLPLIKRGFHWVVEYPVNY